MLTQPARLRSFLALSALAALVTAAAPATAETYVRYNQAGYTPDRTKIVVLMADEDLAGQAWSVSQDGAEVLSGTIEESVVGAGAHTPLSFNHRVDLTELGEGSHQLVVPGADPVTLKVEPNPYGHLINQVLRHLRVARSGTDTAALHPASHLGDASCPVYRPHGDPADGAWALDDSAAPVDMLGGWYDAGDYIKFTLTNAYTTYFLLRAYEVNPSLFTKEYSETDLVDVLDEAKFGLDYLEKTFPRDDTFVIQVSTGDDHDAGWRLPQDDTRDGSREALAAISVTHMAYTAAALAKGAQVFAELDPEAAERYRAKAEAIFERSRQADAIATAFERDTTNDFYRDTTPEDNLALAAIELYELAQQQSYLDVAASERSRFGGWQSWGNVDVFANQRIGQYDEAAASDADAEIAYFVENAEGTFWSLPLQYTWASLTNWLGVAAAAGVDAESAQPTSGSRELFWALVDYTLGRNNWGVAFIASPDLPNSVRNVYSQIYTLTGEFPLGAVSEGPGDKATHDTMQQYYSGPLDTSLERFNTGAAVFYDDEKDFMTQEAVIVGQANAVFVLALASAHVTGEADPTTDVGAGGSAGALPDTEATSSDGGCQLSSRAAETAWLTPFVFAMGAALMLFRRRQTTRLVVRPGSRRQHARRR